MCEPKFIPMVLFKVRCTNEKKNTIKALSKIPPLFWRQYSRIVFVKFINGLLLSECLRRLSVKDYRTILFLSALFYLISTMSIFIYKNDILLFKQNVDFLHLVAEAGFERCDLQVMGLTSYRAALLCDVVNIISY